MSWVIPTSIRTRDLYGYHRYARNFAPLQPRRYARTIPSRGYEEERPHFELSVHWHAWVYAVCLPASGSFTMSTGTTPGFSLGATRKRRVPRYKLTIPLNLTVLRSGIPDSIPARTLEIGEGGMGVVVASKLLLGESVRVEFLLPHTTSPVRATAVVRYQRQRCFGLEFLRLPLEQQSTIRYWTRCEGDVCLTTREPHDVQAVAAPLEEAAAAFVSLPSLEKYASSRRELPLRRIVLLSILITVVAAVGAWWRWQQEWASLEAHLAENQAVVLKPQLTVPPDAMQRRIRHKAAPEYPEAARRAGVEGTVLLNAVVSPDGGVTQVRFVRGPEALSQAAIDAVRWWRYEPYIVNGQPATVETTVAVDFRLPN